MIFECKIKTPKRNNINTATVDIIILHENDIKKKEVKFSSTAGKASNSQRTKSQQTQQICRKERENTQKYIK